MSSALGGVEDDNGFRIDNTTDTRSGKSLWLDGRALLLLGWRSSPICSCLSLRVTDVRGLSLVLCCCCSFPGTPLQFDSVDMDCVHVLWRAFQVGEVVPVREFPPWWVSHHAFRQGPCVIYIARARKSLTHRTSVMDSLVHGMRISHEDGRPAHRGAIRQQGEHDQAQSIRMILAPCRSCQYKKT